MFLAPQKTNRTNEKKKSCLVRLRPLVFLPHCFDTGNATDTLITASPSSRGRFWQADSPIYHGGVGNLSMFMSAQSQGKGRGLSQLSL